MGTDTTTMAGINLSAVLRTLEQLPPLDPVTADLTNGPFRTIQFAAPGVDTVRLAIGNGTISHHRGAGPADIKLLFPRPSMVNAMFAGTGNPVPTKGFSQLSWLKGPFTTITDRLTHHLRHTPELLADPEYARINTVLTLHLATCAMAEIGNRDPIGRHLATGMPDGDIQLAVREGPALVLRSRDGRLSVHEGVVPDRRATMVFVDLDTAGHVLRGEVATYTALGRGGIELSGYVPMLDKMNKLLGLVPRYLA